MMREERPDASLLIGLHKLADQNGEGMVPELYTLLAQHADRAVDMTNVVAYAPDRSAPQTTGRSEGLPGVVLPFGRCRSSRGM